MKILFVSDVPLEKPASGAEQMLNSQASRLADEDLEVYAITRQSGPPKCIIRDVSGVREGAYHASPRHLLSFMLSALRYPVNFYKKFKQNSPFSLIIGHQPFNLFVLFVFRKILNVPLLYFFHSPCHEEYLLKHENRNALRNYFPAKLRKMIENFCIIKSNKIMVASQFMKQKVMDIHGIAGDRIVVNPGGVDIDIFHKPVDRILLKKKLGFPENKVHLLTVRNLEPRMGLDMLLRSMSILNAKQTNAHLTIGGAGPEKSNLERLIDELDIARHVNMAGFIPAELLPHYYGAADFFIIPTRQLEGFGLVTPESLACGTPVLGTPVGGTKEILSNFDARFLFRDSTPEAIAEGIEAAIKGYLGSEEKYSDLRIRCRKFAKRNYSWQRHLRQLRSVCDDILNEEKSISSVLEAGSKPQIMFKDKARVDEKAQHTR